MLFFSPFGWFLIHNFSPKERKKIRKKKAVLFFFQGKAMKKDKNQTKQEKEKKTAEKDCLWVDFHNFC